MKHSPVLLNRLFYAVRPPAIDARRIEQQAVTLGLEGQRLPADRLHVTLDILNDYPVLPDGLIPLLIDAGGRVAAGSFRLTLDRLSASNSSVALRPAHRNAGLVALQKEIRAALRSVGLASREGYRFNPHMTLAYRKDAPFSRAVAGHGWLVDEFVLILSHVGRSRHEILARWPLTGSAGGQLSLF